MNSPANSPASGFTLIELTVTLSVVGVLAALSWGGYSHHVQKTRRAEGRAALLHVLLQQERQYAYRHSYQAFSPGANVGEFKWYSGEHPGSSAYSIAAGPCDNEDLRGCVRVAATPGQQRLA
jgi:type IV pilus assembly protein PilE